MVRSLKGNKLGTGLSVLRDANNLKIEKGDKNGYSTKNFDFVDFFQATGLRRDQNLLRFIFGDPQENYFYRFTTWKKKRTKF